MNVGQLQELLRLYDPAAPIVVRPESEDPLADPYAVRAVLGEAAPHMEHRGRYLAVLVVSPEKDGPC
jgi:hypothetical protein